MTRSEIILLRVFLIAIILYYMPVTLNSSPMLPRSGETFGFSLVKILSKLVEKIKEKKKDVLLIIPIVAI